MAGGGALSEGVEAAQAPVDEESGGRKYYRRPDPIPFRFHGTGGEYFRIWMVNTLLSFLTVGLYSAWAKVRRKRWFYGNTTLAGSPFEYHAEPLRILKGRLAAFAFLAVYGATTHFYPDSENFLSLFLILVVPWVALKSLSFNARNSSWRNVRFTFRPNFGDAASVFVVGGILVTFTAGLGYPYYLRLQKKFMVEHTGFGTVPFSFYATNKEFYAQYFWVSLFTLAGLVMAGVWIFHVYPIKAFLELQQVAPDFFMLGMKSVATLMGIFGFIIFISGRAVQQTLISNLLWNNVEARNNRFESTMRSGDMIWLYLTNAMGILCSFGLLIPWARVRVVKYRLEHLKLLPGKSIDDFTAEEQAQVGASGEALGEFMDWEVGL